jgi:hypothetical protein
LQVVESEGCFVGAVAVHPSGLCVYAEKIANPRLFVVDLNTKQLLGTLQKGALA